MADQTTKPTIHYHNLRQRIEQADMNTLSTQMLEWDDEQAWALMCDINAVINGLAVTHSSVRTFNVGAGVCLYEGKLLKDTATPQSQVTLDENGDLSNERIDLIYIDGPNEVGTSDTKVLLGAYSRTPEGGEAVGTGDDSTKIFDLDNAGVDISTLKVQVDGVAAGGWNLSPGTGTGPVDQIIFGTAPDAGLAITADYEYETGGEEANASVTKHKNRYPNYAVEKGTPGAGVPAAPSGALVIAHVEVPAGWTGGAPTEIVNGFRDDGTQVKQFMIDIDADNDLAEDNYAHGERPSVGLLYSAVRGMSQVVHGCRLQWKSATQFVVTPGWGVMYGMSFRNRAPQTITIDSSDMPSAGWYYVYGILEVEPAGMALGDVIVAPNPPDSLRRENSLSNPGAVYLGSLYAADIAMIRPFYTHGQWVYWEAPTALSWTADVGTYALIVTDWVPLTGRLFSAFVDIDFVGDAIGKRLGIQFNSHLQASSKPFPKFAAMGTATTSSLSIDIFANGILRAEFDDPDLKVHYTAVIKSAPDDSTFTGQFYVLGYLDDYRTMDESGAVPSVSPGY